MKDTEVTVITEDGQKIVVKGKKGDPGYTPQKGVDYYDGEDGKPGKDGHTPTKEELTTLIEPLIPEPQIIDINQIIQNVLSQTSVQVKNLMPEEITAPEIRDLLETLKDDDRLDVSAIKGLEDYENVKRMANRPFPVYNTTGSSGIKGIIAGTGIVVDNSILGYPKISATATGAVWGSITGTLSSQTDLQTAINAKQNTITLGTTSQYFRGDLTLATFPTNISSFTNDAAYITSAGAPVQSVSNSDSTLTISPTSGAVVASLNLAHANTWTALQTFGSNISFGGASVSVSSLTTGDNLQYNGTNWVNKASGYSQIVFGSASKSLPISGANSTIAVTFPTAFTGGGTPKVIGLVVDDGGNITGYQYNVWAYARSETNSGFTIVLNSNLFVSNTYTINYMAIK